MGTRLRRDWKKEEDYLISKGWVEVNGYWKNKNNGSVYDFINAKEIQRRLDGLTIKFDN